MSPDWQLVLGIIGAVAFGVGILMFGLLISASDSIIRSGKHEHRYDEDSDK